MKTVFKVVPDTNVMIASEKHPGPTSPNKEFVDRWKREEFVLLYSEDTLLEYIYRTQGVAESSLKKLIQILMLLLFSYVLIMERQRTLLAMTSILKRSNPGIPLKCVGH